MNRRGSWLVGSLLVAAIGALGGSATAGGTKSRIFNGIERDARGSLGAVRAVLTPVVDALDGLERGDTPSVEEVSSHVAEIERALLLLAAAERVVEAALDAGTLAVQQPGVVLPPGFTAKKVARGLRNALKNTRRDLERARDRGTDHGGDLSRRQTGRLTRSVRDAAAEVDIAVALVIGEIPRGVVLDDRDPDLRPDCILRNARGVPSTVRRVDEAEAKARYRGRKGDPRKKSRGGKLTDEYTAVRASGKDTGGFLLSETLLELDGDVDASVEIGRFSDNAKVVAASGDGEFQCIEVSTVGSAPAEAFVSACGRFVAGENPGFQGYLAVPGSTTGNLFLPGVTRAELRVELRGGTLTAFLREADTTDAFQQIAVVAAPAGPLTFSLGAAGLGPKDEVGFDDLYVEALADPN